MKVPELAEKLSVWIRERVRETSVQGAVLGLSGGVDSAVVGALCQRALRGKALGLIMPCHSDPRDVRDALKTAQAIGLRTETVILDRPFDILMKSLHPSGKPLGKRDIAAANVKPRLRMITLYYYANRHNYLVVGTGNMSELCVGYFTKYGDGGVDILPLGNLVKSDVRLLAGYLGIPQEIIDKPPSAGLWEAQTDEGELGVTYEELDAYLLTGQAPVGSEERLLSLIKKSQHKRKLPPRPEFGSAQLER